MSEKRKKAVMQAFANIKIENPKWKPKDAFLRDMNHWVNGILTIEEVNENIQDRMILEMAKWRRKNQRTHMKKHLTMI